LPVKRKERGKGKKGISGSEPHLKGCEGKEYRGKKKRKGENVVSARQLTVGNIKTNR